MVVEGTVARGGDLVRISARLVVAATGRPIWAESYDQAPGNVLQLQSDVARAIVEKVRVRVTPDERARLANAPQVNPQAHDAYLRGWSSLHDFDKPREAVEWYQRAISADPGYAAAYAGLGEAYAWLSPVLSADEAMPRARAAAQKALELDPDLAQAHATLGYVRMVYDFDREGAERDFRHALALSPGDLSALQNYGVHLVSLGRFDEAIKQFRLARQTDPLSLITASMSLWPLFEGRRYPEAIAAARRLIAAYPDSSTTNAHIVLAQALFFSGARAQGIEEMRRISQRIPGEPFMLAFLGYLCARSGDRSRALEIRERLKAMAARRYVQPYLFAIIHVGLDERSAALDILEKALEERSDELIFAKVDPTLDPIRNEPRFQAILRSLKFL